MFKTLAERTYEEVRARILSGEMEPGFQIRQDVIAAEFGCSKIPLREALARLEQDGLLFSYPNRGYVVRPLSVAEAEEIFDLRLKLEPRAMARAAVAAGPEERAAVVAGLATLEAGAASKDPGYHLAHGAYHMALIRPGGLVTLDLLERLHILAERYVRAHLGTDVAQREHRLLAEAWLAADAERVEVLAVRHLTITMDMLNAQFSGQAPAA